MKEFLLTHIDTIVSICVIAVWLVVDIIRAVKSKDVGTLKQRLLQVMEYVEQYTMANGEKLDGEYKLAFAKALLIGECKQLKIPYNEEKVTEMIETLIGFSKKVNNKKESEEDVI